MILYGLLNTKLSDMSDKVVVTIPEKVLCKAIQIKDCRAAAFCGWWSKVYRESSSRKRNIENEEQYHEYQIWHVGVQEELDELKQEKRNIKKQIQLADGIVKEDLYTAYYAVSGNEEIVGDKEIEIPWMEELETVSELEKKTATDIDDVDMGVCRKEDFSVIDEQSNIEKEQADLYVEESREMDDGDAEQIYTGKNVAVDDEVPVIPMAADKVEWIANGYLSVEHMKM